MVVGDQLDESSPGESYWRALLQQGEIAPPSGDDRDWPAPAPSPPFPYEGAFAGSHAVRHRPGMWERLEEAFQDGTTFEAPVIGCNKGGPRLEDVFGRTAGTLPDFTRFTDALRNSGIVWDAETLDRFLADPTATVPRTWMWAGKVEDARRRRDVIAFLRRSDRSLDICPR